MKSENNKDKISIILIWLQRIISICAALFVLVFSVIKGIESGNNNELISWILGGILSSIGIGLVYFLSTIWDLSYKWLTLQLGKYIAIRRRIIVLFETAILIVVSVLVFYSSMDSLLKAILAIFFLLISPSAISSLLHEDKIREKYSIIGERISPELVSQNPQAAIEYAFSIFEDSLRKRLKVGNEVFGENLINLAYGQEGTLLYGTSESERKGIRNVMSGVYSIYRNPRKHRIIMDDRITAIKIIGLIELLLKEIDESIDRI